MKSPRTWLHSDSFFLSLCQHPQGAHHHHPLASTRDSTQHLSRRASKESKRNNRRLACSKSTQLKQGILTYATRKREKPRDIALKLLDAGLL